MKKIIALLVVLSLFAFLFSCSKENDEKAVTTTQAQITENETVETTEEEPYEEQTTRQTVFVDGETIAFDNGTYRFEIQKTDFENKYPEELLLQFSNMLSMSFGVEDYYDWNTTGQNIYTDVRNCSLYINDFMVTKGLFDNQFDEEAYKMFLNDVGLKNLSGAEAFTVSLEKYNKYLIRMFGPDARQLSVNDFETGKTAIEKGNPVNGDIGEFDYRCFYSGKDDIIVVQACATGFSCIGEYIYNVENDGEDYYVYSVGEVERLGLIDDFNEFQAMALNEISQTIYKGTIPTKKYKFGIAQDGTPYLKSVEARYLIAENAEYSYYVASDIPAEFKMKKAYSEEYKTVETLNKGDKVLVVFNSETRGVCEVITEKGYGIIESKHLKRIEE